MPEDKDDLIRHYKHTRAGLLSAIDGLSEAQMCDPSIDTWSIKDHLAHIALWDEIRAAEVARISDGYDTVWKMDAAQDNAFNMMAHDLRRNLALAQVRWELDTTRQRLLDAIAAATPRGLDPSLYGEAGLRSSHEAIHTPWLLRWRAEKGI
jgi:uncharacterized damage-inducible protein DinB